MKESAVNGFTNATDAADYLVLKGVPFRDAHGIIGRLVLYCIQKGCSIDELSIEELKQITDAVSVPVVAIGGINADNLTKLGKNMTWLKKRLSAEKQSGVKTIFLMTVDSNNDVVIIPKEES